MGNPTTKENWREWYEEWGDRLLLFARQQAGTCAEAEDLLQEAFVQVWSKRDLFPHIEPGLFFTHIRRLALNRARSDRRRQQREHAFAVDNGPGFFQPVQDDAHGRVQQALEQLPREQREVLVLKIWGGQTYESIGNTLDISPNTAASRYRYGLEGLRRLMKGDGR